MQKSLLITHVKTSYDYEISLTRFYYLYVSCYIEFVYFIGFIVLTNQKKAPMTSSHTK